MTKEPVMESAEQIAKSIADQTWCKHQNPSDYDWYVKVIVKALESYAAAKVEESRRTHNERVLDVVHDIRNAALDEATKICEANTTPSKELCNSEYHDSRWCSDCNRMTAMADILGQEIRTLKSKEP